MNKFFIPLVTTLACSFLTLSTSFGQTLTQTQVKRFNQIYKNYGKIWLSGYKALLTSNISPGVGAHPVAPASTMVNQVVVSFYKTINANKKPTLVKNRYTFPGFNDFEYANQVCKIVLANSKQMARLEKNDFVARKFCEYTTFYYGLFVEDFSKDKVSSINAYVNRRHFTNQQWNNLTRGRYGFSYSMLQTRDLQVTRLGKYVQTTRKG
ncbi:hypothetical protein CKF54_05030 [Psittacicella hinzii]|uniref:Uncharacterized protein n=1 Tax=Psittacicella hinzii TaxID=2028575 RepID=A0A3A1Y4H6_9GAMM|nr:hypothetical protein [Psittacicella hinzii]RIY32361.1 hypothetical protein CKF54_05030 [Psittacicella hinzii]